MPLMFEEPLPPVPPSDLIARVTPQFRPENREVAKRDYHDGAVRHVRQFEAAAAAAGAALETRKRLLDFGCGPGRMMRLLGGLAAGGTELHGVDVDPELVGWAQRNVPFASFVTGPHEPPLPYEDEYFDVVLNHSVFTHLDRGRQDMWLAELQRVTAPGAILLLTVHSARQWNDALIAMGGGGEDVERYRRELETTGLIFFAEDSFIGTTHPDWYHTTFHAPWYVFEHWSQFFMLRAYLPEGSDTQDLIVLERLSQPDPSLRPIGHGTADQTAPATAISESAARPAIDHARRLLAQRGARSTAWGRVRARLLRGELARGDEIADRLIAALDALADAERRRDADVVQHRRSIGVLRGALDEQATRQAHAVAELRAELDRRDGQPQHPDP